MVIKANFTTEQLRAIYEVCSKKELYKNWEEVADVLNKRFGTNYSESCFRKAWQYFDRMYDACKDIFVSSNDGCRELDTKKREFERAKIQFRDERNAWQRQNYNTARVTQKLDYLEDVIKNSRPIEIVSNTKKGSDNKTAIICCSDWHIGESFDNEWGKFNSDIARKRIEKYANEAMSQCMIQGVSNVIIAGLGDLCSGSIHTAIAITNRENVIEQIVLASELMLGFVKYFVDNGFNVTFTNVCGNHTRIAKKEDAVKDERLDNLIGWFVSTHLSGKPNFKYVPPQDTTLAEIDGFMFAHGDNDRFDKSGLANLVLAKGYKPKAVFMGHMHTFAVDDCYDIKICRGGSLCGSGNDYTIEKRLKGNATQFMAIAVNGEVSQFYNFNLS